MDFLAVRRAPGLALLLLAMIGSPLLGADEYTVKAAFVYNFTKFVEWPAAALPNPSDPFRICVAGGKSLETAIAAATAGKRALGKALQVLVVKNPREVGSCQVLYLGGDEEKQQSFLAAARGTGVLTVGESEDFLAQGGIIRLKLDDDRVRIVIDIGEAERSRLHISARLLSLAEVIK